MQSKHCIKTHIKTPNKTNKEHNTKNQNYSKTHTHHKRLTKPQQNSAEKRNT